MSDQECNLDMLVRQNKCAFSWLAASQPFHLLLRIFIIADRLLGLSILRHHFRLSYMLPVFTSATMHSIATDILHEYREHFQTSLTGDNEQ